MKTDSSASVVRPAPFAAPSIEELVNAWQQYIGGTCQPAPVVFGAMRVPEQTPTAIASIDLCEVVRQTSNAVRKARGRDHLPVKCVGDYADAYGEGTSQECGALVCQLMNDGMVPPVDGIERIAAILQSWRAHGVYVAANTSTLPGCELATFRFMSNYLPNSFDAILLPRNYDNSHHYTKGSAAADLTRALHAEKLPSVVLHIDDLAHHNESFIGAFDELGIEAKTFSPHYAGAGTHHPSTVVSATPLESFIAADTFLHEALKFA